MNQMTRFGVLLGVICLIATFVLSLTYQITKPLIDAAIYREEQAALKVVMPEADIFKSKTVGDIEYFDAYKGSSLVGYCLKVTGSGYSGFIHGIVGIDRGGVIKGVRIIDHQETPGLGSKISEVRHGETEPRFLRQFRGKDARAVVVKKGIDAIAGATISSRAVTESIKKTVTEFLAVVDKRG